jgi:hypothetical protein
MAQYRSRASSGSARGRFGLRWRGDHAAVDRRQDESADTWENSVPVRSIPEASFA